MLLQLLWEVNAVVMLDFSDMPNRGRKLNPCELWKSYLKYTKKIQNILSQKSVGILSLEWDQNLSKGHTHS